MRTLRFAIVALVALCTLSACGAEYYARRRAIRDQRLAQREQRRALVLQQRAARDQQRMLAVCADPQAAFERGHNDGLDRNAMDTRWVARCPYQYQQQQQQAYMSGYQQGIERAGTAIVVAAPSAGAYVTAPATYGVASCTFSSDCGADMSCRRWGDAGNVCMGYGGAGSPCWFGSDCLSGSCAGFGQRTCR